MSPGIVRRDDRYGRERYRAFFVIRSSSLIIMKHLSPVISQKSIARVLYMAQKNQFGFETPNINMTKSNLQTTILFLLLFVRKIKKSE